MEDIDSSKFKKQQAEFVWNYYGNLRGRPITCDYKMILVVDEALRRRPGQLHGICNLQMLTSEETIALFAKNGFDYVDGIDINYRQKTRARKIFAFTIKEEETIGQ